MQPDPGGGRPASLGAGEPWVCAPGLGGQKGQILPFLLRIRDSLL